MTKKSMLYEREIQDLCYDVGWRVEMELPGYSHSIPCFCLVLILDQILSFPYYIHPSEVGISVARSMAKMFKDRGGGFSRELE